MRRFPRRFDWLALLALAILVRVHSLDRAPLWGDELFSVYWSQLDWHFLLGQGARMESNPPGYYLLLHFWLPRFGTTAAAARTLSVLCSSAAVPMVYALGRTLLDRPTALLAGLFAAVEPTSVLFAQQARPYAVEGLLDAMALFALAACDGVRRAPPWRFLALFIVASTGALLFHYTAIFFIAACYAAIAAGLLTTRPFPRRAALIWAGAGVVMALAAAWLLWLAISLSHSANLDWIGPLSPRMVAGFFVGLLPIPDHGVASFVALAALFLMFAVSRWRLGRVQFGVLLLVPILFCLILIGASVWQAVLLPRVGAWLFLPLCVLLARAVMAQPNLPRRLAVAGVTLTILLSGLGVYFHDANAEDWRGVAWLIATEPNCGGPVLVSGDNALGLAYYGARLNGRPLFLFPLAERDRTTAEFVMTERLMHLPVLEPGAVVPYARDHKSTMVLMRRAYLKETPAPLAAALQQAPFRTELSGGLMISCF